MYEYEETWNNIQKAKTKAFHNGNLQLNLTAG